MTAIFGYTGFIGSYLTTVYLFDELYNSKNIESSKHKKFKKIFISCIPSEKWKANMHPEDDFINIECIKQVFKTIESEKVILISTIDVYEDTLCGYNEDYKIKSDINHVYGKNRYLFEEFILQHFENVHIVRLPSLFGRGLKKNIIYDLLNNKQVEKIDRSGEFQWYDIDWLKDDIEYVITNNIKLCNLFTEPLKSFKIMRLFDYDYHTNPSNNIKYNVKSKYFKGGYIRSKEIVFDNLKKFILNYNKKNNFCISNISSIFSNKLQYYNILKYYGFKYLEIAPTLFGSWNDIFNTQLIKDEIDIIERFGMKVYSLQSICYNLKSNIFDNDDILLNHLKSVVDISLNNNIKNIVFGCPSNRRITNVNKDTRDTFINFFANIGNYIGKRDLKISLENNSSKYGCNFLNNIDDIGLMANTIKHPNIKIMIDVGNCEMENDNLQDIKKYKDIINHVHFSEPFMKGIRSNKEHFLRILKEIKYNNIISFEFKSTDFLDFKESIHNIINIKY